MRLVLTGGWGAGPPLIWRSKKYCQFLKFLASDKGGGWGDSVMPDKTSPGQEKAGKGDHWGVGNLLSPTFLPSAVRSNLIPSPPTYDSAHDYLSWESFSNMSYYTRILPSVPRDCPTPMGTKGNGGGRRGWGRSVVLFGKKRAEEQLSTHFADEWTKERHCMTYPEPGMRMGLGNEDRKGWGRVLLEVT